MDILKGKTSFATLEKIIESVHFESSDQSNFLQVADLLTYNIYRQFTDHGDEWDDGETLKSMTKYPYFARYIPKFDKDPFGNITGYGLKKFP